MRRKRQSKGAPKTVWWLAFVIVAAAAAYAYESVAKPSDLARALGARYAVIDLSGARVLPAVAEGECHSESFSSMISRLQPYAAITGTYHDAERNPLGDLLADGKLIANGRQRQGIGFCADGRIVFRERTAGKRIDWTGCRAGIACGPRLVRAGKKSVDVSRDGFSNCAATLKARRCAIGATRDSKLILCFVPQEITLDTLAELMVELGAVDAVNLDGGSMCALYVDGVYHAEPVARMNNILVVFKSR